MDRDILWDYNLNYNRWDRNVILKSKTFSVYILRNTHLKISNI